jgi:CheY-like chemotaxis protein
MGWDLETRVQFGALMASGEVEMPKPIEILLAEDNPGDALLVARVLEDFPIPVRLHAVHDGIEALVLLADGAFQPDLVIVDLNMPNLSGHEFLERFHPDTVPVVVFSSSEDQADIRRALQLGAREYVRKPASLTAYREAVRGMIEKWVGPLPSFARYAPV